jgi:predicted  nucleic acid-binding Zn-ribbon protein
LSTLTKVLIVLLTVSSIFLCGIVVTYVANADNYKQKYENQNNSYQAAKRNEDNAKTQLNNTIEEKNKEAEKLGEQIASLEEQINKLNADLANAGRERDDAVRKVNNWMAIVKDFSVTVENNQQLVKDALAERDTKEAELIKQGKELKDTTAALMENMAIVRQLQEGSKRLLEEKTELQNKLDQYLRQYGKAIAAPSPVTPMREAVRVAPPTKDIDLNGMITEVDLKNLLAEISIGAAEGVKAGMRFHLTRNDKFICDIVILDVWPEKAVGWLELLQEQPQNQPKINDKVSTNL